MKTLILAAVAVVSLGLSIARADPVTNTAPQSNTEQITAGAAGWG